MEVPKDLEKVYVLYNPYVNKYYCTVIDDVTWDTKDSSTQHLSCADTFDSYEKAFNKNSTLNNAFFIYSYFISSLELEMTSDEIKSLGEEIHKRLQAKYYILSNL